MIVPDSNTAKSAASRSTVAILESGVNFIYGWKASCTLEELQIAYTLHPLDIMKGQQWSGSM
jgi:glutathione S-transferase